MAQTVNEIQDEIMANAAEADNLPAVELLTESEQQQLGNITSTSKVGVTRKFVFVMAKASVHQQEIWDVFKQEIEERIAESRPFTKRWYRDVSLLYQHDAQELSVWNEYNVITPEARVVKKAAVVQTVLNGVGALRLKVAGEDNGELAPISQQELDGFQEYIERKGAAGVFVAATTGEADKLKLQMKIYFDPMVLNNQGHRLDGTADTPVQDAIKNYLKVSNSRDFNGSLSLAKLTDIVQAVPGVVDPFLLYAASKYAAFNYEDVNNNGTVGQIADYRQADSGYFKLDEEVSSFEFLPA
jgi:hypothetical protein